MGFRAPVADLERSLFEASSLEDEVLDVGAAMGGAVIEDVAEHVADGLDRIVRDGECKGAFLAEILVIPPAGASDDRAEAEAAHQAHGLGDCYGSSALLGRIEFGGFAGHGRLPDDAAVIGLFRSSLSL
jgi:hypothetical protein